MINLGAMKKQITSGNYQSKYIMVGDEPAVMRMYIDQLEKKAGLRRRVVDTYADVIIGSRSRSLVDSGGTLYVVRYDNSYIKNEGWWPHESKGDCIVLIYDKFDKRTRAYKQNDKWMVDFMSIPDSLAIDAAVKAGISKINAKRFSDALGGGYTRALIELDKVIRLSKNRRITPDAALELLWDEGLIPMPLHDAIFTFTDEVCKCRINRIYAEYDMCIRTNEPVLPMLTVLFNNLLAIYLLEKDKGGKGVCDRTGLTGWQVKVASAYKGIWKAEELRCICIVINDVVSGLKMGRYEEDTAIEYVLMRLLYGA